MEIIPKLFEKPRTDFKIEIFNAEQQECVGKGMIREFLCAKWDNSAKKQEKIVAIGINPSTAHNGKSDTTITKLCRFLDMHGFNKLSMLNLYEDVSSIQLKGEKIKTDFNTKRAIFDEADIILIVWGYGENKELQTLKQNAKAVLADYKDKLYCIKNSKGKLPVHPSRMHYIWDMVHVNIDDV